MLTCTFEDGNQAPLRHAVVDALVLKDNQLLLVKRTKKLLEGGKWGLVGGYVDRDENLQQAVAREVEEETGYLVSNITLLTIRDNPDRPKEDRQNISFVFFCHAGDKVSESDWEVDDQQWFDFDDLPPETKIAFDHFKNIQLYKQYTVEKFPLPVLGD